MRWLGLFLLVSTITALAALPRARGSRQAELPTPELDRGAFLRQQLAVFQSLPPERQDAIRALDRSLNELDPSVRQHYFRVLDKYSAWLDSLPDEDRKRVAGAPTAEARLVAIREIRQREWLERQPLAHRETYKAARTLGEKAKLIEKWRQEEQERDEEWQIALRHWNEVGQGRIPAPFQSEDFRKLIDRYVANLDSSLTEFERTRLKMVRQRAEEGEWLPLGRLLVELSDRHPLLPASAVGPRTYDALPSAIKQALPKEFAKSLPKPLESASGRWPDFAVAVTRFAHRNGIKLTESGLLGPTHKQALPPEARLAVDRLEAAFHKADNAKDLQRLKQAEGQWPRYPEVVMELARQHKAAVPGWTLPTPANRPEFWNGFRVKREKNKS